MAAYEKIVVEHEFVGHLLQVLGLNQTTHEAGVSAAYLDPKPEVFGSIVAKDRCLELVFNDGKKWISDNSAVLKKRFQYAGFETHVFLVDPEGAYVNLLARKTRDSDSTAEQESARIREKIEHSIKYLKNLSAEGKGKLTIWYNSLSPAYTAVVGDSSAIITLYTNSNGRHWSASTKRMAGRGRGAFTRESELLPTGMEPSNVCRERGAMRPPLAGHLTGSYRMARGRSYWRVVRGS